MCRCSGTERAFTGKYWDYKADGVYTCVACGTPLFLSEAKYDSGSGWPSYFEPVSPSAITENLDDTHGMATTLLRGPLLGLAGKLPPLAHALWRHAAGV